MEADWEAEIGGGAPVIDAAWSGFVDLLHAPARASELPEAMRCAPLGRSLARIHRAGGALGEAGFWTSKCDVWELETWDADELDASPDQSAGIACYLDLLPRLGQVFATFSEAEGWTRRAVAHLRLHPLRGARADLIVRSAIAAEAEGFGITAYVSACGENSVAATQRLSLALDLLVDALDSLPETRPREMRPSDPANFQETDTMGEGASSSTG